MKFGLIVLLLFTLSGCSIFFRKPHYSEETIHPFWQWFIANENELYIDNDEHSDTSQLLVDRITKLDKNLTIQMSKNDDSNDKFRTVKIGSIECCKQSCTLVKSLIRNTNVKELSELLNKRWKVEYAAHPPCKVFQSFNFVPEQNKVEKISASDFRFTTEESNGFINLTLYTDHDISNEIVPLSKRKLLEQSLIDRRVRNRLLDEILGEYFYETRLGNVLIEPLLKAPNSAKSIDNLLKVFQGRYKDKTIYVRNGNLFFPSQSYFIAPTNGRKSGSWQTTCRYSLPY